LTVSTVAFEPTNFDIYVLHVYMWVITIARRYLRVKVVRSGIWVSKNGNAVGLTSILDRGQFVVVKQLGNVETLVSFVHP